MKINEGFEVRTVCGEHMMVAMGEKNIDFSHVIAFNETSVFIWNQMLAGKDTIDDVAKAVTEEYEVDFETARKDVETLVKQLAEYGAIVVNEPVVRTENIITSYCPQTGPSVAFLLLEELVGTEQMQKTKTSPTTVSVPTTLARVNTQRKKVKC